MALIVKADTAKMEWKTKGAVTGVHAGQIYALMHCTKGANLAAGDTHPPGEVASDTPVEITASVFVEATEAEANLGTRQFGMVQVTELHTYEFLYVGRLASEGSTIIDMKKGLSANPSLDSKKGKTKTVDQRIFDPLNIDLIPSTSGAKGFKVVVAFSDHPNNAVPLQFENRVSKGPNFLARLQRNQHFVVFFVTRENATAPITILGRLGWAVQWDAEFNWTASNQRPQKPNIKASNLFPGIFMIGAPPASDPWATIALNRPEPTTNAMDEKAATDAWDNRKTPICQQLTTRPDGFRENFFK